MTKTFDINAHLQAGLSIIPIHNKIPTIKSWAQYQERVPEPGELEYRDGYALICGKVSGNIEVLDVDVKHVNPDSKNLYERIKETFGKEFLNEIQASSVIQSTPSGGCHFIYRCPTIGGNQKLAKNDTGQVILETRGEGGYIAIAPTPGYTIKRGSLLNIPTITPEQRTKLFDCCNALNEHFETSKDRISKKVTAATGGVPSWEAFNKEADMTTLLEKHGWSFIRAHGPVDFWKRPGNSTSAHSASYHRELNTLYVYTSSVPQLQQGHAYTPYAVLTYLEYEGDFSKSARALWEQGYGRSNSNGQEEDHHQETGIESQEKPQLLTRIKKLELWLNEHYEFRKNIITNTLISREKPDCDWQECNENDIWRAIQNNITDFGKGKRGGEVNIPLSDICSLLDSDFVPTFNPFVHYFSNLPEWDGIDHISNLASYVQTDNQAFWTDQFKKALVRSIACTLTGTVNRIVMTLVGEAQESGKCFGRGTKVRMADFSIKNVEDIKVGDQVLGPDGAPRNVLELHTGMDQMYWVRQNNAMDYRVNSTHILSLQKRPHRYGWQEGRKINIHLNQFIRTGKEYQFNHLGYRSQFEFNEQELPIDPYFIGLWLGDGSSKSCSVTTADSETIQYLNSFAEKWELKVTCQRKKGQHNKAATYFIAAKTKNWKGQSKGFRHPILTRMRNLNLIQNKHIPNLYKFSSREQRLQLLAGIIDSDGYLNKKQKRSYEVTFKNYILAKDLQFLCLTLGFRASLHKKIATMKRKDGSMYSCDVYRVGIFGKVHEIPCIIPRKKARVTTRLSKNSLTTGISIIEDTVDQYFGFTTDGDHLFCLEDFTVVHNSSFLRFLCPPELRQYYKEEPLLHEKDSEIALAENFIWNLEELDDLNKKQISEMKAIISRESVKHRRAYARRESLMKRIVNFWGSTNKTEFLTDTQNTRWLCFNVLSINHNYNNFTTGTREIDINKVWAHAYYLFKSGFHFQLNEADRKQRDSSNKSFESMPEEKQLIIRHFTMGKPSDPDSEFLENIKIKQILDNLTNSKTRLFEQNIGRALAQLGFKTERRYINGKQMRGWWVKVLKTPASFDSDADLALQGDLPF